VKRILTALMMVGAAVVGVIAFASANTPTVTTLCKEPSSNHDCPWGFEYPAGIEIKAKLAPESKARLSTWGTENGIFGTCSNSELTATIYVYSNSEGKGTHGPVALTFSECTETHSLTTISTKEESLEESLDWLAGSNDGELTTENEVESSYDGYGSKCKYLLPAGRLVGGGSPQIVFSKTILGGEVLAERVSEKEIFCPKKAEFQATYNITNPTQPLYVLNS
jgi:hypothetical protein